jgi:putative tricarboxylic transport membrane protein
VGPKGLSAAQVAYWEKVFARLVATDEWKRDMEKNYWSDFYLDSRATEAFLEKEYGTLKSILGDLGLAK